MSISADRLTYVAVDAIYLLCTLGDQDCGADMTDAVEQIARAIELDELMAQVVVHGDTLYLSGQVSESGAQDFASQMRDVLGEIERQLQRFRSSKNGIVSATIYLPNRQHLSTMNLLWRDWLSGFRKPARTTVIAELIDPAWLVEISVIAVRAAIPSGRVSNV